MLQVLLISQPNLFINLNTEIHIANPLVHHFRISHAITIISTNKTVHITLISTNHLIDIRILIKVRKQINSTIKIQLDIIQPTSVIKGSPILSNVILVSIMRIRINQTTIDVCNKYQPVVILQIIRRIKLHNTANLLYQICLFPQIATTR